MASPSEGSELSFERDIKPMFRTKDRDWMLQAFVSCEEDAQAGSSAGTFPSAADDQGADHSLGGVTRERAEIDVSARRGGSEGEHRPLQPGCCPATQEPHRRGRERWRVCVHRRPLRRRIAANHHEPLSHVLEGIDKLDGDARPGIDDDGRVGHPGDSEGPRRRGGTCHYNEADIPFAERDLIPGCVDYAPLRNLATEPNRLGERRSRTRRISKQLSDHLPGVDCRPHHEAG